MTPRSIFPMIRRLFTIGRELREARAATADAIARAEVEKREILAKIDEENNMTQEIVARVERKRADRESSVYVQH